MAAVLAFVMAALLLHSRAPTTCVVDSVCDSTTSIPLTDLAYVRLYGIRSGPDTTHVLLEQKNVRAGEAFTLTFNTEVVPWSIWTRYTNTSGHEGCESKRIVVGSFVTESVEIMPATIVETTDVAGRRIVGKPTTPGIYFVRELRAGKWSHRRVVVLE